MDHFSQKTLPSTWFIPAPAGNGTRRISPPPPRPVHPRACGERTTEVPLSSASIGSSPRLRGTGWLWFSRAPARRFIPAPAGNGPGRIVPAAGNSVHPRACGERGVAVQGGVINPGSSPRLRGTVLQQLKRNGDRRFIPAPAGNGIRVQRNSSGVPVHPRACGERKPSTIPV